MFFDGNILYKLYKKHEKEKLKKIKKIFKKVLTKGKRCGNINKSPRERSDEKRKEVSSDLIVSENFKKDFKKNLKKLLTNDFKCGKINKSPNERKSKDGKRKSDKDLEN